MASVRTLATCIGIGGNLSVLGDLFGFFRGVLPPDPTGAEVKVSLRRQLGLLQGEHFHVNVIAVGVDNFVDADDIEVDYSIFKMRNIYNQVGVGVGRIQHHAISVAQADGLDAPTNRDQLEELTENWSVNNNGIDLFVVHDMNIPSGTGILLGRSAVDGPCPDDKDDKGMSGSTTGLWGSEQTARTTSHELGHYLTLQHRNNQQNNLLCQSGQANSTRNSIQLTNGQGNDVKGHCMSRDNC
ncbi:MAG: hypothetical protein AAES65_01815 [Candidatus Thiodiazotropha sp. (ex. Lucinoma kazani)]|nr:hypothetical protein [Candidatus Thiodiazotropha sp. (ex Lucinoma borealis)]